MDWIAAHRKALLAALTAVLVLVVDQDTVDKIIGAVGVLSTWLIPNDEAAAARLYPAGSIVPRRRRHE